MKILPKDPVKTLIVIAYIFVGVIFAVWILPNLVKFFLPAIIGFIISIIIEPWVDFLEKKVHIPRKSASVITILFVIFLVGLILFNLVYQAVYFLQTFAQRLPGIINQIYEFPEKLTVLNDFIIKLPEPMQNFTENIKEGFLDNITELISPATTATLNVATQIAAMLPQILIFTVTLIFSTFFLSCDRENIKAYIKKMLSEDRYKKIVMVKDKLFEVCGAYFRAQLIMMCIMFCVIFIGMLILSVESPAIIALIVALVDGVPILGTGTVLIPWAIVSLITGKFPLAIGLVILYVCALLVRQLCEPKVVSSQIGLAPIITITAMYVGFSVAGIFGLILGPITAMVVIKTIEIEREYERGQMDGGAVNDR